MSLNSETNEKGFAGRFVRRSRQLLGGLLFLGMLTFAACDQYHPVALKTGAGDYHHYSEGGGLFVSATFGPDGRLWRIVPEKQHVYVDFSTDLGKSFSPPALVNKESQRIKASGENRPGIAVDRSGRIFVAYAAEGDQPLVVYSSVSDNHGQSFSTPSPLSGKAPEANSYQAKLALSPFGQVHAFWHDERDRTDWRKLGNAIYYTTGAPGGFDSNARKLADSLCDCCRIAAAFDPNDMPVVLTRFIYPGDIRDHGLIRMNKDSGEPSFRRVTYDQWHIEACPEHGPAITISDDRYHIAWFTQGTARQGLFYANSSNRGEGFSEPMAFGNPDRLPGHPDISARGNQVVLAWTEYDGVKTQLKIMQSDDGGQGWSAAQTIAEAVAETDFPFLLRSDQGIFVSWNCKAEGYRLISLK
ncbi:MAG: sialidase family protein [Methylococcales bacterium]